MRSKDCEEFEKLTSKLGSVKARKHTDNIIKSLFGHLTDRERKQLAVSYLNANAKVSQQVAPELALMIRHDTKIMCEQCLILNDHCSMMHDHFLFTTVMVIINACTVCTVDACTVCTAYLFEYIAFNDLFTAK